jgi:hypothetical protein
MNSTATDRAFNCEASVALETLAFAAVESRMDSQLARQELETIKDESIATLFRADALLSPRIAGRALDARFCRTGRS